MFGALVRFRVYQDLTQLRVADHPEVGQTSQYKDVYRYRSDETVKFPQPDFWDIRNVKFRLGRLPEGEVVFVEASTLIPVCSSTRSLKFRPFRGSSERRCSLTKPPRLPLVVSTNGASAWFG